MESENRRERAGDDALTQVVTFTIGEEEFGVDILRVQEIIRMVPVAKMPGAPKFVEGVINLRGRIIPIIDLRRRFGMAAVTPTAHTRITVMDVRGQVVGFIVDTVREVLRVPGSAVEAPPAVVSDIESDFLRGVGKLDDRLLLLLDVDKLLSESEKGYLGTLGE